MDDETLVFFGDAVKAIEETPEGVKVGGYLVRFTTDNDPDLSGEYFTADTDFGSADKADGWFNHRAPVYVGNMEAKAYKKRIGTAYLKRDDVGVWAEMILQARNEYEQEIAEMAKAGKLGWSSGTASHLVDREPTGKSWKITSWPLGLDASLTPTPCEPRNDAIPLKSLITEPEAAAQGSAASVEENVIEPETPITNPEVKTMEITEEKLTEMLEAAAVKAVEMAQPASTKAGVAVVKDEADQPFESLGQQLKAVKDFALSNGRKFDPRLAASKALGMNEALPSEGGFLVQQDFTNELLRTAYDTGVLASRVRRFGISSNSNGMRINAVAETSRVTGSRYGGMQAYWLGEGGTKTPTMPVLRQMNLDLKKLIGLYYATDELLQDASALQSFVGAWFSEEFGWMIDEAILNGGGGAQPLGISTSPALVVQAAEGGQAIDTIVHENIVKMWSRMVGRSRANAIWVYNQDCEPQLYTMGLAVGFGGTPSFLPPGGLSGAPYATLMGRPAIPMEQCATLGNQGDIMLIDPTQYIAIDKGGIQSASSIHVAFLTDETTFRFVYRFDGQPAWNLPVTPATGSANTLSPFVALAAR